jgi:hypothetical protein
MDANFSFPVIHSATPRRAVASDSHTSVVAKIWARGQNEKGVVEMGSTAK